MNAELFGVGENEPVPDARWVELVARLPHSCLDVGVDAELYERRSRDFYWAHDLSLRFTLDDGSSFHRIYSGEVVLRDEGAIARFAMNLPLELGERVVRCEVVARPLGHYDESSRLDATESAASFYEEAVVLGAWNR